MKKISLLGAVALITVLGLSIYPSAYAWSASPQIAPSNDASGNVILTIKLDFSQMADPPGSYDHYPTDYQVRTSTDGSSWTDLPPVHLSYIPATSVFTVYYNLGKVTGPLQVQARLNCNIHGWSDWGPEPGITAPEFPLGLAPVVSLLALLAGLIMLRRKRLSPSA